MITHHGIHRAPLIRYRVLSEYRGSLIKFLDTTTQDCFILRADKIVSNHKLFQGFNEEDAQAIAHCARGLLSPGKKIQTHETEAL